MSDSEYAPPSGSRQRWTFEDWMAVTPGFGMILGAILGAVLAWLVNHGVIQ